MPPFHNSYGAGVIDEKRPRQRLETPSPEQVTRR